MEIAVTGQDILQLGGRTFTGFADEDNAKVTFPDDLANSTTGKDGNAIVAYNYKGKNCVLEMRILIGSADDVWLNNQLAMYNQNPPGFVFLPLLFTKIVGDSFGNINRVKINAQGGFPKRQPDLMENASGDTKQAVQLWTFKFINADRMSG